jgi:hypothetical protein
MAVPARGVRPVAPATPAPAPAAIGALAARGAQANRAAVNRDTIRDAATNRAAALANRPAGFPGQGLARGLANRPALPAQARGTRPFKRGGETAQQEFKDSAAHERAESNAKERKEHMAAGGAVKQGGGGTAQFGEGRGYPVMKHGNSGLGRLEKIKKAPV